MLSLKNITDNGDDEFVWKLTEYTKRQAVDYLFFVFSVNL